MRKELYKLFSRKENICLLICSLLLLAVYLFRVYVGGQEYQKEVGALREAFQGQTWKECAGELEEMTLKLGEAVLSETDADTLKELSTRLEAYRLVLDYVNSQREHKTELINQLNMYKTMAGQEPSYYQRAASQAFDMYNYDTQTHIWDGQMLMYFNRYLNYRVVDLLFLITLILVLSRLFVGEEESGMQGLLDATKRGRRYLYGKKLITALAVIFLYALIFTALQTGILLFRTSLPLTFLLEPVQCLSEYEWCPYRMRVLELLGICVLARTLSGLFAAGIITLFSVIFPNILIVLTGSILTCGLMAFHSINAAANVDTWGMYPDWGWNHIGLINAGRMMELLQSIHQVDVFGYPVDLVWLMCAVTIGAILWVFLLARLLYMKNSR